MKQKRLLRIFICSLAFQQSNEMSICEHSWVFRIDGYEEQCGAAICSKCGKYGCYCDFVNDNLTMVDNLKNQKRKKEYEELGIYGNNHELEKKVKKRNKYNRFEIMDI